jgi:cytochrome c-type biogenesis protein CcmE
MYFSPPTGKQKRLRLYLGAAVILVVLVYLVISSTQGSVVYAMTLQELVDRGSSIYGQGVRVGGNVDGDSISFNANDLTLRFTIYDGGLTLPVEYKGAQPDMFRDEAQVLVEGKYSEDGLFRATKLLLKCPSKYEAAATQTATR